MFAEHTFQGCFVWHDVAFGNVSVCYCSHWYHIL